RRLSGRAADPRGLRFTVFGQGRRPIALVPVDECGRSGRVRRQRLVAWGASLDRPQRSVDADRGSCIMADRAEIIDLSHVIEEGMTTYKGLPGPHLCDFWERESTAANYDDGSTFQIGRIDMVANTGTYLDSPFHRYADGADLSELELASLADVPGIVVRRPWENGLAIEPGHLEGADVAGKAVLVHTGWDRHWRTDGYFGEHPYLTAEAADSLRQHAARGVRR